MFVIDLQEYTPREAKVLSSRPWGIAARIQSGIDEAVEKHEILEIHIPADIASINPSFLEEFLGNAIFSLGKDNFLQKVQFISHGRYKVEHDLKEAISHVLKEDVAYAY